MPFAVWATPQASNSECCGAITFVSVEALILPSGRQRGPTVEKILVSTGFPFPLSDEGLGLCPYRCPFEQRLSSSNTPLSKWVDLNGNGLHLAVAGAFSAWSVIALSAVQAPASSLSSKMNYEWDLE